LLLEIPRSADPTVWLGGVMRALGGEEEIMRHVLVSSMALALTRAAYQRRLLHLAAFLACALLPASGSALNAIQNPSFELDDGSWTLFNATTRPGAGGVSGHTGSYHARIGGLGYVRQNLPPIPGSQVLELSLYATVEFGPCCKVLEVTLGYTTGEVTTATQPLETVNEWVGFDFLSSVDPTRTLAFVKLKQLTTGFIALDDVMLMYEHACADGDDDDGDGLIDYPDDPGCSSATDESEKDPSPICDDGLDNDGDGLVDLADPGCEGLGDLSEQSVTLGCDDGIDNDGDGLTDFADPQCTASWPYWEAPPRLGGCGLGVELVAAIPILTWLHGRRRRRA
jgi:hypothetical protein